MRTTEEILELIVNVAKEDPDIRAVLMSGSRANKDCPVDQYQEFDIVYFVKDVQPYWDNMAWIEEEQGIEKYMKMVRRGEILKEE